MFFKIMDWYIILQDSDFRQLFIGKNDCLALCSFRQNNAHTTPQCAEWTLNKIEKTFNGTFVG